MGKDNQPKARQVARRDEKAARRDTYARILIVSEGTKTEPLYFDEIRAAYRLHSANVAIQAGQFGTAPVQVVQYAQRLFEEGDLGKGIRPKSFDQVYAVFDRDEHASYFDALRLAESLDGKLRNDEKSVVSFKAIASIPCFELWLLLHFEAVESPISVSGVVRRLKLHFPAYAKGEGRTFQRSRSRLNIGLERAKALSARFTAYDAPQPYTAIADLVSLLVSLRG